MTPRRQRLPLSERATPAMKKQVDASSYTISRDTIRSRPHGTTASISARNRSRRVCFFFIACVRPGKAGCFGIGAAPLKVTATLPDQAQSQRFFRRFYSSLRIGINRRKVHSVTPVFSRCGEKRAQESRWVVLGVGGAKPADLKRVEAGSKTTVRRAAPLIIVPCQRH